MKRKKVILLSRNSSLGSRLTYYDLDKQRTRIRLFNPVEIEHTNEVFDIVNDTLLENDLYIRNDGENKWMSIGKCGCLKHDDTYFIIEVDTDLIDVEILHAIEESQL